ncbi:MAG: hypothetical protein HC934_01275 [Acaryochloridaceae cyanobacterium SU_2_1]|nr:hypothetical protein [Acaryochloridaceae cyanobacterium SU_2_1]
MDDATVELARFELLSAYLDGETTAEERKQVEALLEEDFSFQQSYQQLLQIQRGFQALPAPVRTISVEQTLEQVLARVERKPRIAIWTITLGSAAAATIVAAVAGLFSGGGSFLPQTAYSPVDPATQTVAVQPRSENLKPSDLMIALDRAPVELPQGTSSPIDP